MRALCEIYGQFMLRLCLWCLGSIAAGVAFCVLASIAKRYAKLVRRVGLFAAILLSTFIFGMIREGGVTQEDKEESLGRRVSLLPDVSSFQYGLTPSNTYAFAWMIV